MQRTSCSREGPGTYAYDKELILGVSIATDAMGTRVHHHISGDQAHDVRHRPARPRRRRSHVA
eukprot:scaffold569_cov408-Prasinococcus_capsulatus_cf.AAC.6